VSITASNGREIIEIGKITVHIACAIPPSGPLGLENGAAMASATSHVHWYGAVAHESQSVRVMMLAQPQQMQSATTVKILCHHSRNTILMQRP
jgi:hypothetical protein